MSKKVLIRVSRHEDEIEPRLKQLEAAFGTGVKIANEDVPFKGDPRGAIQKAIDTYIADGCEVVAVEVPGKVGILSTLVGENGLTVPVLKAVMVKDTKGESKVVGQEKDGRDVLSFSHYELVMKAEVLKRELRAEDFGSLENPVTALLVKPGTSEESRLHVAEKEAFLSQVAGCAVRIEAFEVTFGNRPSLAVEDVIPEGIIAIDAQAPLDVLSELTHPKFGLKIPILEAQFKRDSKTGRVLSVGKTADNRDIFEFSHYEVVEAISLETKPLVVEDKV